MSDDNVDHGLLLDLDALYDTRFGTLLLLNREAALKVVRNGYHTREIDNFETLSEGLITNAEYKKAYAKRDIETLKKSIISGIPAVLVAHIETLRERMERGVNVGRVSITINTWPYLLPGPVIAAIIEGLGVLIPEYCSVNARRIDLLKVGPQALQASYDGWCTYDFDSWLAKHHEELLYRRANDLTVILPRLHISAPEEFETQEDDAMNKLDKPSLQAMVLEEFIHLEHLPVCDFCYFTPGSYTSSSSSSTSTASAASGSST